MFVLIEHKTVGATYRLLNIATHNKRYHDGVTVLGQAKVRVTFGLAMGDRKNRS